MMTGLEQVRDFMIAHSDTEGLPLVDVMIVLSARLGDATALAGLVDLAVNAAAMSGDLAQQDAVMAAMATGSRNLLLARVAQRAGIKPTLEPSWTAYAAGSA